MVVLEKQMTESSADADAKATKSWYTKLLDNVVKEMIFVSDIEAFRDALPIRARFYDGAAPPAATWIEVSRFMRPDFVIEIEVTAEIPPA